MPNDLDNGSASDRDGTSGEGGSADAAQPSDRPRPNDTGAALRSIYQKTVDESVPDEMLDLLGKLS